MRKQVFKTVWPSGLRRWLQAPVRKGVGSNPTAVSRVCLSPAPTRCLGGAWLRDDAVRGGVRTLEFAKKTTWHRLTDSLAEWSKALASGASPQGRGFEPHSCQPLVCKRCGGVPAHFGKASAPLPDIPIHAPHLPPPALPRRRCPSQPPGSSR